MNLISLCGLTLEEIFNIINHEGFTKDHALKICNGIYKKRIQSTDSIPGIPRKLKEALSQKTVSGIFMPLKAEESSDGTVKYLFSAADGRKFETVYIPDEGRHTVCVSSQSGCRMGCPFCVTGRYGFHGNLSAAEIVNQVLAIRESATINRVVFMGMGEPMDNLENVLKACDILCAEWGKAVGVKNITVSSVGVTPAIKKFLQFSECNLAVSLFSPFPQERIRVVPAENKYPVHKIIELMKDFPVRKKRRLTLSYVMMKDVNDSMGHLRELKRLLHGSGVRINLLPYHTGADDAYSSSPYERMQIFMHELASSGIQASVRKSRGADISAACGLLASGLS